MYRPKVMLELMIDAVIESKESSGQPASETSSTIVPHLALLLPSHLPSQMLKSCAASVNNETSVATESAPMRCAHKLLFYGCFPPPDHPMRPSLIAKQAVILRGSHASISEHVGCRSLLLRRRSRMLTEDPHSSVPRTRTFRPTWVSSLP